MASTPLFGSTLRGQDVAVSNTANTARDGTGTITEIVAGITAGTRIEKVEFVATGDLADGCISIFFTDDGAVTWRYYDGIDHSNPAAGSTTLLPWRGVWVPARGYVNLPSASHRLGAAQTVAPTTGGLNAFAFGTDFT